MCWLWDLSECMGWADGSHAGSWLRNRQQVQRPASSHGGVASAQQAGGAAGEAAPGGADVEMSEGPAGGDHEVRRGEALGQVPWGSSVYYMLRLWLFVLCSTRVLGCRPAGPYERA